MRTAIVNEVDDYQPYFLKVNFFIFQLFIYSPDNHPLRSKKEKYIIKKDV